MHGVARINMQFSDCCHILMPCNAHLALSHERSQFFLNSFSADLALRLCASMHYVSLIIRTLGEHVGLNSGDWVPCTRASLTTRFLLARHERGLAVATATHRSRVSTKATVQAEGTSALHDRCSERTPGALRRRQAA